jgi:hypothetical protein
MPERAQDSRRKLNFAASGQSQEAVPPLKITPLTPVIENA